MEFPFPMAEEACPHAWDESCMKQPPAGTRVNKDECVYCCHTSRHDEGVYVCMCCFTGVCRAHLSRHMALHPTHAMYTTVREIPAPKLVEKVGDTNNLGVEQPSTYESHIVCAACSLEMIPGVGCTLDSSYERIILSTSAAVHDAVLQNHTRNLKQDCPHVSSLVQGSNPFSAAPSSNQMCACCECNQNNWMCLQCGEIGCPRKEAGGNGHAIFHNMMTNHSVVFKLGTIVEGHGDVYCYACDDSVYDPHFAQHVAHFGINSATAVKTAKTLGEMEYDITSRHDFNAVTEAGATLVPVYGPGFTGLRNMGNSCYLASVVQCLFSLSSFVAPFAGSMHRQHCSNRNPADCHHCQLERLAEGMMSGAYARVENAEHPELNGITPRLFKKVFASGHPLFSTGDQQDASEFLTYLLKEVHRRVCHGKPSIADPTTSFDFLVQQKSQCSACRGVKYSQRMENLLQLPIPVKPVVLPSDATQEQVSALRPQTSLEACLTAYLAVSPVECRCERCGQATVYEVSQRLLSFPDVLIVNPRREYFDHSSLQVKKLDVYVNAPLTFSFDAARGVGAQEEHEDVISTTVQCEGTDAGQSADATVEVDEVALATVVSIGIDMDTARWALSKTNCDVERAIDFVFSHPEGPPAAVAPVSAPPERLTPATDGAASYELSAMISHIGSSALTGHYVCHTRAPASGKWVLFNDEKVAASQDPPFRFASVYFYTRKS